MTADAPTNVTIEFERPTSIDAVLRTSADVRFLELPPRRYVMIDGNGPPGDATFAPRMPGLYATAWTLRFALKRRGIVTKVGPLEGLWWTADGTTDLDTIFAPGRDLWRWTLLIGLPEEAAPAEVEMAVAAGRAKLDPELASGLRARVLDEGRVAQVLHLGPYAMERATLERLHGAIAAAGLRPRGRHHEIYLGDPRRSAPDRLRTILRQPVA
ncbi:MAG TPA: GyrI-like domain-containing protein [Candidatus Limnocylindrales bacterium]|nr:GyrI-like domain-containing protein [Candidatus Limnocylindrales bacterium]